MFVAIFGSATIFASVVTCYLRFYQTTKNVVGLSKIISLMSKSEYLPLSLLCFGEDQAGLDVN
jgi:hypothetical protein